MKLAQIVPLFLSLIFTATAAAKPLQLELPSTSTSATTLLNATILQQHSKCFGRTVRQRLYNSNFQDCEHALHEIIALRPNFQLSQEFSQNSTLGDFKLPFTKEHQTCQIKLFTREYNDVVAVSMYELYANLMDEDGVLQQCLHMPTPTGGETSLGWGSPGGRLLFVEVKGVPAYGPSLARADVKPE